VATFDHHCPWLGTCVGEKNKRDFFVYLNFQLLLLCQMVYLALKVGGNHELSALWRGFGVLTVVTGVVFALFVLNLILFHAYFICKNITTWEQLRWSKISYLQDWQKKHGSPFDLGVCENLKLVFCNNLPKSDFYLWKMPYWQP
jgi:palmitoyltransferase